MKKELAAEFDQEVDAYRRALLYNAKKCDWETFEAKAGKMFDYVESVEFQELERRFFKNFSLILGLVIIAVIAFFSLDFEVHQDWLRWKNTFLFSAIAVCTLEIYFFINYRIYIDVKTYGQKKRRVKFIYGVEADFRKYTLQAKSDRT
jgi:hypothetical protein